jgi:hypothetical protein
MENTRRDRGRDIEEETHSGEDTERGKTEGENRRVEQMGKQGGGEKRRRDGLESQRVVMTRLECYHSLVDTLLYQEVLFR